MSLKEGDAVRVVKEAVDSNSKDKKGTVIPVGTLGEVKEVDGDGDARIDFHGHGVHWVLKPQHFKFNAALGKQKKYYFHGWVHLFTGAACLVLWIAQIGQVNSTNNMDWSGKQAWGDWYNIFTGVAILCAMARGVLLILWMCLAGSTTTDDIGLRKMAIWFEYFANFIMSAWLLGVEGFPGVGKVNIMLKILGGLGFAGDTFLVKSVEVFEDIPCGPGKVKGEDAACFLIEVEAREPKSDALIEPLYQEL